MYFTDQPGKSQTDVFWSVKYFFELFLSNSKIWIRFYQKIPLETIRMPKWPFSGWSVKYTILAGVKIFDPMPPLILSKVTCTQNLSSKYWNGKKLEGGPIFGGGKIWWRHQVAMTSSLMTKFFQKVSIHIMDTLSKFHVDIIKLSKVIKNFRSGA